ncbi:NADPH-flavin oxidoreductase [uncultured Clostridium sp.]|nr:NADPH-flavin oxidoreductase [uncultured Clostridium sp.]
MNAVVENIMSRRSVRRFKPQQLSPEHLRQILEAGLWAPSAGGRQSAIMLVCQDAEANEGMGRINRKIFGGALKSGAHIVNEKQISIAEDDSLLSAFYGAPTVITIFAPEGHRWGINDCTVMAQNLMLAAWSLGVGSVHVTRAEDTFATEQGQALMKRAGIGPEYVARCSICLGYPDGEIGEGKPRRSDRSFVVE